MSSCFSSASWPSSRKDWNLSEGGTDEGRSCSPLTLMVKIRHTLISFSKVYSVPHHSESWEHWCGVWGRCVVCLRDRVLVGVVHFFLGTDFLYGLVCMGLGGRLPLILRREGVGEEVGRSAARGAVKKSRRVLCLGLGVGVGGWEIVLTEGSGSLSESSESEDNWRSGGCDCGVAGGCRPTMVLEDVEELLLEGEELEEVERADEEELTGDSS